MIATVYYQDSVIATLLHETFVLKNDLDDCGAYSDSLRFEFNTVTKLAKNTEINCAKELKRRAAWERVKTVTLEIALPVIAVQAAWILLRR